MQGNPQVLDALNRALTIELKPKCQGIGFAIDRNNWCYQERIRLASMRICDLEPIFDQLRSAGGIWLGEGSSSPGVLTQRRAWCFFFSTRTSMSARQITQFFTRVGRQVTLTRPVSIVADRFD
jgi:hypothetical protein